MALPKTGRPDARGWSSFMPHPASAYDLLLTLLSHHKACPVALFVRLPPEREQQQHSEAGPHNAPAGDRPAGRPRLVLVHAASRIGDNVLITLLTYSSPSSHPSFVCPVHADDPVYTAGQTGRRRER